MRYPSFFSLAKRSVAGQAVCRCAIALQSALRRARLLAAGTVAGVALTGAVAGMPTAVAAESLALSFDLGDREAVVLPDGPTPSGTLPLQQSYASAPLAAATALGQSLSQAAGAASKVNGNPGPSASPSGSPSLSTAPPAPLDPVQDPVPSAWWEQGSASPIAVTIGNAEGTRRPDGGKTEAYHWHEDPGNGANNFGTFSYQHLSAAMTTEVDAEPTVAGKRQVAAAQQLAEISDQQQLQRLRTFYGQLQRQAHQRGLTLSPLEVLNGLDLINQSEAAGLAVGGYVDRLADMKAVERDREEQIREARTWSYWHPERKAWDAPGLGNSYASVRRDQDRRFEAVKYSLASYVPQGAALIAQSGGIADEDPGAIAQASLPTPPAAEPPVAESPAAESESLDLSAAETAATPRPLTALAQTLALRTEALSLDLGSADMNLAEAIADQIIFSQF